MATFDPTGAKTMITAPQYDFRPLPYLVSLGFVGAATAGIFFGAGFLLLAPPLGVGSSADPVPPILDSTRENRRQEEFNNRVA